jgi:hypothetical protein
MTYEVSMIKKARILTYIDDNSDDGNGKLIPSNSWKLLSNVTDSGHWMVDPKNSNNNSPDSENVRTLSKSVAIHFRQEMTMQAR